MLRKIAILATALLVTGCWDPAQERYNIEQEQHERGLDQIMNIYDLKCSAASFPGQTGTRNDDFCDGIREAYWAIQADRNLQGFPAYEKMREAKKSSEPSAR